MGFQIYSLLDEVFSDEDAVKIPQEAGANIWYYSVDSHFLTTANEPECIESKTPSTSNNQPKLVMLNEQKNIGSRCVIEGVGPTIARAAVKRNRLLHHNVGWRTISLAGLVGLT